MVFWKPIIASGPLPLDLDDWTLARRQLLSSCAIGSGRKLVQELDPNADHITLST